MKKALVIIALFATFLITYFLQSNFFYWFTIGGIMPNLFVILQLFISLFVGTKVGITYGVFFGIFLDVVMGKNVGIYTIMLTIVSMLGIYFDKNFSKDSRLTIMLMVIASTFIFELGCYVLNIIMQGINIEVLYFIKTIVVEIIYNAIITIIIYPGVQLLGYKIEEIFKEQKILTRYF